MTYPAFAFWIALAYFLGNIVTFLLIYPPKTRYLIPRQYRPFRPMRNSELMQAHGENVAKSKPDFVRGQNSFEKQHGK